MKLSAYNRQFWIYIDGLILLSPFRKRLLVPPRRRDWGDLLFKIPSINPFLTKIYFSSVLFEIDNLIVT